MNAAKNNVCDAPRHDDVEAPAASKSPARASSSDDAYGGMLGYVLGLFVFYVGHDALQEHNFRREGFEFGWFMTCVEIGTMFACALIWEGGAAAFSGGSKDAAAPEDVAARRWYLVGLVFVIALSQGTGSVALQHVNYPVKVAFKSCKLVPTMLFSQCVNKSSYGTQEYAAAALMCLALALLGLADAAHATHATHAYGLLLLVVAVCSDAVVPNFQEKLLRGLKMPLGTMVIYSNAGSFALVLAYVSFTGELARAVAYLATRHDAATGLLLQALAGYGGLRCYLSVIRGLSGVAGVLTTSARKVVTLVLSFVLFSKPFTAQHAAALLLLFVGVGISLRAKHRKPR